MAVKTHVTKPPTGLQVERRGNEFSFSWKIVDKDHGKGQVFQYQTAKNGKWHKVTVTASQTSITVELDPTTITALSFRVKGRRKPYKTTVPDGTDKNGKAKTKSVTVPTEVSAWKTKTDAWVPQTPTKPTVEYEQTNSNAGTFTVKHTADTNSDKIAKYVQYSTCVSKSTDNPPKDGWSTATNISGTSNVDSDVSYTEQTETITKTGLVRWFRARCQGPGGTTKWVYSKHAYSHPETPELKSASAKTITARSKTSLQAQWTSKSSLLKPIDEEALQYVFAVPTNASCTAPSSGWTDAATVKPSGKQDIVSASVSDMIATDQCLWVRVAAKHDTSYVSYSKAIRVMTAKLAKPGINATPNFTTGQVSITITINTSCAVAKHAIFYRPPKKPKSEKIVAILAAGVTTTTVTVSAIVGASKSCFGAYAFVGSSSGTKITNVIMQSDSALDQDIAPVEPDALTLNKGADGTSVAVGLNWKWSAAEELEISWADNNKAWESNVTPKSYTVTETGVSTWYIQGLDIGKTWYFRGRYNGKIDTDEVTSAWSDISSVDLSTDPDKPTLKLSRGYVLPYGEISATWDYVNEDNSPQECAEICIADISGNTISYGDIIGWAGIQQMASMVYPFVAGTEYYLCCRVKAKSGKYSDWSNPVGLHCPSAPQLSFSNTVISNGVMTSLSGYIGVTVSAYQCSGEFSASIIRADDYHVDRPDDGVYDGYRYETIWSESGHYNGGTQTTQFTINKGNLVGELDDGARYILVGTFTDEYGQTVTDTLDFKVNWSHKAAIKKPTIKADKRMLAMRITPVKPSGWVEGDVFDIYRITTDQPELIVRDGEYGTTYVDPYPGFGRLCGHRVVAKTATGSYITSNNSLAWYDLGYDDGDCIESNSLVIDANGIQIELPYNLELNNKWQKDFRRTSYLGGSVQGDWNPAVLRDLTAKTAIVKNQDTDELLDLRDLAAYAGPAHIRTPDGSSFACDIQITEDASYADKTVKYSLSVKGIKPAEPDGMTLAEWLEIHPAG